MATTGVIKDQEIHLIFRLQVTYEKTSSLAIQMMKLVRFIDSKYP
jgi:hypothetical protein